MSNLANNNAFGPGSPSWNLSFPDGNLTAVEILAYFPHWLKCVDVINRFTNNGAKSVYIATIINDHRNLPGNEGTKMPPNSTTIMMQYAMRRAGFKDWTLGRHDTWEKNPNWNPENLNVFLFRTPRHTHPKPPTPKQIKRNETWACNAEADPIPFKDLALHVKQHPSGDDALDLTRCVLYALEHPDEDWRFPNDFIELVKKLGGPMTVTFAHLDAQVFGRRSDINFHTPSLSIRGIRGKGSSGATQSTPSKTRTGTRTKSVGMLSAAKRSFSELEAAEAGDSEAASSKKAGRQVTTPKTGPMKRRSGRNVNKNVVYNEDTPTDKEAFTSTSNDRRTLTKKRKLSHPLPPVSKDSDYQQNDAYDSAEDIIDFDSGTPAATKGRRSFPRGTSGSMKPSQLTFMQKLKAVSDAIPRNKLTALPNNNINAEMNALSEIEVDPVMMRVARSFDHDIPAHTKPPPPLSDSRLQIDDTTVHLYGDEKSTSKDQLWATAMSAYRYGGPRRYPPFRELHRLTNPERWDASDWAENIRWAKEQHILHGVKTWTEYDDHQEQIKQRRQQAPWVSEDIIQMGADQGKYILPKDYVPPQTLPPPANWTMDAIFMQMYHDAMSQANGYVPHINEESQETNDHFLELDEDFVDMEEDFADMDDDSVIMDRDFADMEMEGDLF